MTLLQKKDNEDHIREIAGTAREESRQPDGARKTRTPGALEPDSAGLFTRIARGYESAGEPFKARRAGRNDPSPESCAMPCHHCDEQRFR